MEDNNILQSVKKRVIIKELVEGKEAATKLKYLLENENSFGNLSSDKLAANVLSSFTKALSIITQHGGENGSPVVVVAGNDRKGGIRCYKRRLLILIKFPFYDKLICFYFISSTNKNLCLCRRFRICTDVRTHTFNMDVRT